MYAWVSDAWIYACMWDCEIASFSERCLGSPVRLVWTGRHHTKEENIHSGFLIFPFLIDYHLWQEGDTPRSCLTFTGLQGPSYYRFFIHIWMNSEVLIGSFTKRGPQHAAPRDFDSRPLRHKLRFPAPRVEISCAASRGPMWRCELRSLGTKLKSKHFECWCVYKPVQQK